MKTIIIAVLFAFSAWLNLFCSEDDSDSSCQAAENYGEDGKLLYKLECHPNGNKKLKVRFHSGSAYADTYACYDESGVEVTCHPAVYGTPNPLRTYYANFSIKERIEYYDNENPKLKTSYHPSENDPETIPALIENYTCYNSNNGAITQACSPRVHGIPEGPRSSPLSLHYASGRNRIQLAYSNTLDKPYMYICYSDDEDDLRVPCNPNVHGSPNPLKVYDEKNDELLRGRTEYYEDGTRQEEYFYKGSYNLLSVENTYYKSNGWPKTSTAYQVVMAPDSQFKFTIFSRICYRENGEKEKIEETCSGKKHGCSRPSSLENDSLYCGTGP